MGGLKAGPLRRGGFEEVEVVRDGGMFLVITDFDRVFLCRSRMACKAEMRIVFKLAVG